MAEIYRSSEFALTQAALDQINFIRGEYFREFPDDPPVLAGVSTGYQLTTGAPGAARMIIGFWRQSEISAQALEDEEIVEVAGQKILFAVHRKLRPAFLDSVIDYNPEDLFVLRPLPPNGGQ